MSGMEVLTLVSLGTLEALQWGEDSDNSSALKVGAHAFGGQRRSESDASQAAQSCYRWGYSLNHASAIHPGRNSCVRSDCQPNRFSRIGGIEQIGHGR